MTLSDARCRNRSKAPFYGIKVTVALYHTQGGLKVTPDGQVLRADGSIIPNLYAGGGVAGGVSGKGLEGYLAGQRVARFFGSRHESGRARGGLAR